MYLQRESRDKIRCKRRETQKFLSYGTKYDSSAQQDLWKVHRLRSENITTVRKTPIKPATPISTIWWLCSHPRLSRLGNLALYVLNVLGPFCNEPRPHRSSLQINRQCCHCNRDKWTQPHYDSSTHILTCTCNKTLAYSKQEKYRLCR